MSSTLKIFRNSKPSIQTQLRNDENLVANQARKKIKKFKITKKIPFGTTAMD